MIDGRFPEGATLPSIDLPAGGTKAISLVPAQLTRLLAHNEGEAWLRNFQVMVYRKPGPSLVDGFVTFALSNEGQRVALDAGLVPMAVPLRARGR